MPRRRGKVLPDDPNPRETVRRIEEQEARLNAILRLDAAMRGSYLVNTINVERFIEKLLFDNFRLELQARSVLTIAKLQKVPLSQKITILIKALQKSRPDIHNNHPELANRLTEIRRFRNILAHSTPHDIDQQVMQGLADRIILDFYDENDRLQFLTITQDEMSAKIKELMQIMRDLVSIHLSFHHKIGGNRRFPF